MERFWWRMNKMTNPESSSNYAQSSLSLHVSDLSVCEELSGFVILFVRLFIRNYTLLSQSKSNSKVISQSQSQYTFVLSLTSKLQRTWTMDLEWLLFCCAKYQPPTTQKKHKSQNFRNLKLYLLGSNSYALT